MLITRTNFQGQENTLDLDITPEQWQSYINGAFVQDAFPHLSLDEREFIITGMMPGEWEDLFSEEE